MSFPGGDWLTYWTMYDLIMRRPSNSAEDVRMKEQLRRFYSLAVWCSICWTRYLWPNPQIGYWSVTEDITCSCCGYNRKELREAEIERATTQVFTPG